MRPMRQGRRVQLMNNRYPQIVQMPSTDAAELPVIPSTVIPRFVAAPNKAVKSFAALTRTSGIPRLFAHGFAMMAQTPLHTSRRLPGRYV